MSLPKPIILFFWRDGERFRHVVGHAIVERLARDALGKSCWVKAEDAAIRSGLLYNLALVAIVKSTLDGSGPLSFPSCITITDDGFEIEVSLDA